MDVVSDVLTEEERKAMARVLVLAEFIYATSSGSSLPDFKSAVLHAFSIVDKERKEKSNGTTTHRP